MFLITECTLVQ